MLSSKLDCDIETSNEIPDEVPDETPEVELGRRTFLRRALMGAGAAGLALATVKPALAQTVITDDDVSATMFKGAVASEVLAATRTLLVTDDMIQWLDPDGASRDVTLPAEASSGDLMFMIYNSGSVAAMNLVVKNDGAGLIGTLGPGQTGFFSCDGVNWRWESNFGGTYDGVALATTLTSLEGTPIGQSTPAAGGFTTGDFSGAVKVDGVLTAINDSWYGVTWDENTSSSAGARTGALDGVAASSSPGDALLPIQAAMRRCMMNGDGVVQYYLDPSSSYNRADGTPTITGTDDVGTASKLSDVGVFTLAESEYKGKYVHNLTDDTYAAITAKDSNDVLSISADIMDIGETFEICTARIADSIDGQVMTEIPAFYYRYGYSGTEHTWDISLVPLDGFSLHPAFIKNGVAVPYRYIGSYEGSMWDASAGAMVAAADIVNAYTIAVGDALCSVSGEYPKTNETRAEYRSLAARRGNGWRQQDYDLSCAIQLLYLVEYADFNSQSMIGEGRTAMSGGTWTADSYIGQCGKSNGDGNGTASVGGNTNAAYMSYRGIENFFGNVWKWMDGINVNDNVPYVCNDDSDFADDTAEGYTALGITLINANGYQVTLEQTARGFLPASVGGASSTYITDYYYQSTGWRVVKLGGNANYGAYAGAFLVDASNASSYDAVNFGGRLAF